MTRSDLITQLLSLADTPDLAPNHAKIILQAARTIISCDIDQKEEAQATAQAKSPFPLQFPSFASLKPGQVFKGD